MSAKHPSLKTELHLAGAQDAETASLLEVVDQLQQLKISPASLHAHEDKQSDHRRRLVATFGVAIMAGIIVGASLIAYAQTSVPGSWLYAPKRLSETVAVAVDPSYRATLMMRRSQEVKDLVAQHASEHVVLATLADYQTEAALYKSTNYAAFEFCKNNLEQAATVAPQPVRTAIISTLASLQT